MPGLALERLRLLPRVPLAHLATPLDRLDRFSEAIGTEVWCKRDDVGDTGRQATRSASGS
jgi:D-cysteine desulfhydrase